MANPISPALITGTIGELLVQLRLLQYGVQAAQPLKDSGNDLIGLRGFEVRCIQVKTTADELPRWPADTKLYHLLAIVRLAGEGCELRLDQTEIFLLRKSELRDTRRSWEALKEFVLDQRRVDDLFAPERALASRPRRREASAERVGTLAVQLGAAPDVDPRRESPESVTVRRAGPRR